MIKILISPIHISFWVDHRGAGFHWAALGDTSCDLSAEARAGTDRHDIFSKQATRCEQDQNAGIFWRQGSSVVRTQTLSSGRASSDPGCVPYKMHFFH